MIGIDVVIEKLRVIFENKLFPDVSNNTYVSYGKAYITKKKSDDGLLDVPQIQTNNAVKYQDLLPNRKINGHSFFLQESDIEYEGAIATAKVGIYFAVNLDKLYTFPERAEEYLHRDVVKLVADSPFKITGWVRGLEAFNQFGFVKDTDNMEPFYLVRFDTEVEYNLNCTN